MQKQIAYKYGTWNVQPLETLSNEFAYICKKKLLAGKKLSFEGKNIWKN